MAMKTIAVLFGGVSSEHDISLISAASVLRNFPKDSYNVVCIGITKDGRWLFYDKSYDDIESGAWENNTSLASAVISPDSSHHGIIKQKDGVCEIIPVDCIFPVLHGKNGEDGTVQGLFDLAGIPYVGCDLISSANCMDKQYTHTILDSAGIKTASWRVFHKRDLARFDEILDSFELALGFPMFVKPANAGSSVGISKAHNREELKNGILLALEHDCKAVIEENIVGAEVECAVLGNEDAAGSVPGQITPCNEFYDYNAKYIGDSMLDIPAKISDSAIETVKQTAVKAYHAIGCSGLSRVDFFVTENDEVILNEINTLPGFTSISMYPKLWGAEGVPYSELINRLIGYAFKRKEERRG